MYFIIVHLLVHVIWRSLVYCDWVSMFVNHSCHLHVYVYIEIHLFHPWYCNLVSDLKLLNFILMWDVGYDNRKSPEFIFIPASSIIWHPEVRPADSGYNKTLHLEGEGDPTSRCRVMKDAFQSEDSASGTTANSRVADLKNLLQHHSRLRYLTSSSSLWKADVHINYDTSRLANSYLSKFWPLLHSPTAPILTYAV